MVSSGGELQLSNQECQLREREREREGDRLLLNHEVYIVSIRYEVLQ